jgi:hypothetical protein
MMTPGSIVFVDALGNLAEDNSNFFWDDTNLFLGIGTNDPAAPINIHTNPQVPSVAGQTFGIKVSVSSSGQPNGPGAGDYVASYNHIQTSTLRNRVWASNAVVDINSLADATAWGEEIDINNNFADAPDPYNTGHKLGLNVVSGGTFHPSAAMSTLATTTANAWKYGVYFAGIGFETGSALIKTGPTRISVDYGIDFCLGTFNVAMMRVPPQKPFVARNNADTADVPLLCLDANDRVKLGGFTLINATASFDPPNLQSGRGFTMTIIVPDAMPGDNVLPGFTNDLQGVILTGYVSSSGIVSVRFQNGTGSTVNLGMGTVTVLVFKR